MKKYEVGMLDVKDPEIYETKEEIIVEMLDRLQKYVDDAKAVGLMEGVPFGERYGAVKHIGIQFSGLADFLTETLKIEITDYAGKPVMQTFSNEIKSREAILKMFMERMKAYE